MSALALDECRVEVRRHEGRRGHEASSADPDLAAALSETQSRIATGLLAHNPSAAEQAAQSMRTMAISDPALRTAVSHYADAIVAISIRERQIADIDNLCWVLVDLISQFSRAVQNELSDIEGN